MPKTSERKPHHLARRVLLVLMATLALCAIAFVWYVNDYYRADATARQAMKGSSTVEVRELEGGSVAFVPDNAHIGLIFYPGGKVEPEAFAPLLLDCAEDGVACVLVRPRFNLAILDMDAADGVAQQLPDVDVWLLAGHSLGGVAASDYLSRHLDEYEGIVLLASYSSADLSQTEEEALCIVGTNDQVLDRAKYEEARTKLPPKSEELSIDGGNHAGFGSYGTQDGDGKATISAEEQQKHTADAIAELAGELD